MNIAELVEQVSNIQGKRWAYLALGRAILNEMESMKDDIQALPVDVSASEQVVRDYYRLRQSLSLYLIRCGYDV